MKEKIQFFRIKDIPDLELYRTSSVARSVPRHIHCVFSLSVGEAGVGLHETKLGKYYITPGSIVVVNADTTHSSSVPSGYTYSSRSIRIDTVLLGSLMQEISGQKHDILALKQPVIYNQMLAQQILGLHTLLAGSASRLEKECLLLDTLAKLYTHYSCEGIKPVTMGDERTPVSRVCEYLQDCFNENVSLDQLASIAGLSAFHLAHVFTKEIGVPPHTYQLQVRLKKATDLLAYGKPLVEAALETGFCDQSHFQKAFKKKFGISPGQYKW
ncbi:AraC family transcriptional regulator [Sporomusa malonica]|uniref:Transcriptional regulator, AraC family n=1 Tax=Sporomusa malonica TaxID=112901 RepID=A0A1W2ETU4_9FIRM|nr:AraC family transcriptional regulator [Sporomusa malonica]SMD13071.1 transcriptional regulator, AraC family [Sporomusa malonica]